MRALIIGGSGGLSGELARQLLAGGHEVWTLTRGNRRLPIGVHSLFADRNDIEHLNAVLKDATNFIQKKQEKSEEKFSYSWDIVFDCICMNASQAKVDLEIVSHYAPRLIVVSTDSVYSPYHKKVLQGEDGVFLEETGEESEVSYGANKRRMELAFMDVMKSSTNPFRDGITIFRPGHIYGKKFKLGCFPENSRQDDLVKRIQRGEPMRLVGMGTYLIHPIYVGDLAETMIACSQNVKTYNEIFCVGGPERIENRTYYEIIGKLLGCEVRIEEIPLAGYLENHPEYSGHLCHRAYDLAKLEKTGISLPSTTLAEGLAFLKERNE